MELYYILLLTFGCSFAGFLFVEILWNFNRYFPDDLGGYTPFEAFKAQYRIFIMSIALTILVYFIKK